MLPYHRRKPSRDNAQGEKSYLELAHFFKHRIDPAENGGTVCKEPVRFPAPQKWEGRGMQGERLMGNMVDLGVDDIEGLFVSLQGPGWAAYGGKDGTEEFVRRAAGAGNSALEGMMKWGPLRVHHKKEDENNTGGSLRTTSEQQPRYFVDR